MTATGDRIVRGHEWPRRDAVQRRPAAGLGLGQHAWLTLAHVNDVSPGQAEAGARRAWASSVIAGVLDRAFRPDELERWWLDEQSEFGVVRTADPVPALWLHVVACGEWFDFRSWSADAPDEGSDELSARLTSDLQDWIAESTFGWGEQRLT